MTDTGIPWRSRVFYLIAAIGMLAPLDVTILGPALPVIADQFGISNARAGLVITVFAVPGVLTAPVIGMLVDRWGRRRVLVPGLLVFGIGGTLVLAVDQFLFVLLLRFFQGLVGGSIFSTLAMTLVADTYDGPQRNAAMGAVLAAVSVSAAVGPGIGGLLAEVKWNGPFVLYVLSLVMAAVVFFRLPEPDIDRSGTTRSLAYLRDALTAVPLRSALAVYGAILLSYTLFFGGVLTAIPFLLDETYDLSAGRIGLLITASTMVAAVVATQNGRFAHRLSGSWLIVLGLLGYGLGLAGTWFAPTPAFIGVSLVLFGVGHGLTQPSVATVLSGLGPERLRGGVMSIRTTLVVASQAIGPPLFTLPATGVGFDTLLLVAGGLTILVALGGMVAVRATT